MSYSYRQRGIGLGQAKTVQGEDNTARDWATATTVGSGLITGLTSIIGAATGQPAPVTPAATDPLLTPSSTAPVSASPDWYWPVIIGVGALVIGGIGYMSWNVKAPIKANRGRRRGRRSRRAVRRNRSTPPKLPAKKTWYCIGTPGGPICLLSREEALTKYSRLTTEFGPHYTFHTVVSDKYPGYLD